MKINIELDLEYIEITGNAHWKTSFGDVYDIYEVYALEHMINNIINSKDSYFIVNSANEYKEYIVKGLLKRFKYDTVLLDRQDIIQKIVRTLQQFREGTGYNIKDYKFEYSEVGESIKLKDSFGYVYDSLDDMIKSKIESSIRNKTFKYEIENDS